LQTNDVIVLQLTRNFHVDLRHSMKDFFVCSGRVAWPYS